MKEYCIWGGRQREWGKQRAGSSRFSFVNNFLLFSHHIRSCFSASSGCLRRDYSKWVQLSVRGTTGRKGSTLTSVWMSWQRCSRILLTKPKTSTLCSMCIMSIMLSMTINVPVLPTPALWKRRRHKVSSVTNSQVRQRNKMCQNKKKNPLEPCVYIVQRQP